MKTLIEQIQSQSDGAPQQSQTQEVQPTGKSFNDILQIWQQAGQPKNAVELYKLLIKALGNKDQVKKAFDMIGMNIKGSGGYGVLQPDVVRKVTAVAKQLTKKDLQYLIGVLQKGQGQPQGQRQGQPQGQPQQTAAA